MRLPCKKNFVKLPFFVTFLQFKQWVENYSASRRQTVVAKTMSVKNDAYASTEKWRVPLFSERSGLQQSQIEKLRMLCNEQNGLILVCGEAQSGSMVTGELLKEIARHGKKIMSVEHVRTACGEHACGGQCHCAHKHHCQNMSCCRCWRHRRTLLRTVLAQNVDVVATGKIHTAENAQFAVDAVLAGMLVVSSLSAGDVANCVFRMVSFGADVALLASVLRGVIVQQRIADARLLADIALPQQSFKKLAISHATEDDLNEAFVHYTNIIAEVRRSLGVASVHAGKERLKCALKLRAHFNMQFA